MNADGTTDTTFGDGGLVLMQTSDDQDLGGMAAVAIQRDGKIVGAGLGGTDQNFIGQFAVVRLLPNGALDPAFGNGQGFVTTMVDADSVATDIVLRHNGDMIAAGAGGPEGDESTFALVSYEPDGSLNEDFGTGGIVQTPIGAISGITDVAPFGRKRLLAVGGTGSGDGASFAAARYVLS